MDIMREPRDRLETALDKNGIMSQAIWLPQTGLNEQTAPSQWGQQQKAQRPLDNSPSRGQEKKSAVETKV